MVRRDFRFSATLGVAISTIRQKLALASRRTHKFLSLSHRFELEAYIAFSIIYIISMGCSESVQTAEVTEVRVNEIPCLPDEIAKYINNVRANPAAYADILEREISKFTDEYSIMIAQDVLYRTNEGREVWKEAIQFLRDAKPLPPMLKHEGLCRAAADHAEDLAGRQELSHTGSDKSEPLERVSRHCRKGFGKTGENIGTDFKLRNRNYAENTVLGLVIDDGVSDRGHRHSIFDPDFAFLGSATRVQGDKIVTVINYLSKNW